MFSVTLFSLMVYGSDETGIGTDHENEIMEGQNEELAVEAESI